jgi:hypothetical protein
MFLLGAGFGKKFIEEQKNESLQSAAHKVSTITTLYSIYNI